MTAETRTTIEIADIVAFEFECCKCKARVVRPLTDENKIPMRCVNCNAEQWFTENSRDFTDLRFVLNSLGVYAESLKNRPFVLRSELRSHTA